MRNGAELGRLESRVRDQGAAAPPIAAGTQPLGLASGRDGLLHVPATYRADRPAPLLVLLHGAGGTAERMLPRALDAAEQAGTVLLVPESRGRSWDVISTGGYGTDVAFLDRALGTVFARLAVDSARLAIGGFSDGASYALSLGLANGDLFGHILAFSPGFMAPPSQQGAPRIFISHGTMDEVLSIDRCSRRLAPALDAAGYDLRYEEFDGAHVMPPEIVREAFAWFLA